MQKNFSPRKVSLAEKLAFHSAPQPDGCILWTGSKTKVGYGQFSYKGKMRKPHRVAWEIANGRRIPPGMMICHKCDVRHCINPEHLWLGTCAENLADRDAKGRQAKQRGETGNNARLTDAQARAILADTRSQTKIAADYGVCQQTVSFIKRRITFSHL